MQRTRQQLRNDLVSIHSMPRTWDASLAAEIKIASEIQFSNRDFVKLDSLPLAQSFLLS